MSLQKIKTFIKALLFHVWSGFPKANQEQILERFKICSQGCDMYNKKDSTCLLCGCNVNDKKIFMNKLAWADQECPDGKWKSIK